MDAERGSAAESTRRGRLHGPIRQLLSWLSRVGPVGLLARVRWLFLVIGLLVVFTTLVAIAQMTGAGSNAQLTAVLAVAGWGGWLVHRYTTPDAGLLSDLFAPAALVVMGWAVGDAALLFIPAFVLLFFRAMYGSAGEVLLNGLGYFAARYATVILVDGADALVPIDVAIDLVSFVVVALVMQSLGASAGSHQKAIEREQVLTEVSARLLGTSTPTEVYEVAAEGALRLADAPRANASIWIGAEVLELAANAGADVLDISQAPLADNPPALLAKFMAGRPYVLDAEETRQIEEAHGHPHRFNAVLVGPLLRGGKILGALVLASPDAFDPYLLDFMGRFANEVTLAVERAQLIGDLEQANTDLRHADEMKNQFLSTVSHELRTPLTSIRGFAQTLRRQGAALTEPQRDRFLEIIERQSRHQERLVDDLLTTSRMIAGQLRIEAVDLEIQPLLTRVLEELQVRSEDVEIRCPDDARVHVDPTHLHQIVANLLTNALKYGAPPYVIDVQCDTDRCAIRFHDHGDGIPESFRPHLFEPFTQADSSDRRTSAGTGLGLAIVRNLVHANGGTIVHDPEGPGACFEIALPLDASAPLAPHRAEDPATGPQAPGPGAPR